MGSGDDVGDNSVCKLLYLILQSELPLLHSGQLQLVAIAGHAKQLDLLVETAMLNLEKRQHFPRIVVIHEPVLQEGRLTVTLASINGEPL